MRLTVQTHLLCVRKTCIESLNKNQINEFTADTRVCGHASITIISKAKAGRSRLALNSFCGALGA
jgi:hypothetical protein